MADLDERLGVRHWKRIQRQRRREAQASFDAAKTTEENRAHWSNADGLSAAAANSPEVRRRLRDRARYEDGNNSNASGLAGALADEMIGTGPRLQLTLPETDPDFGTPLPPELAREIECRWREWCDATALADKLHTGTRSEIVTGEVFDFLFVNPGLADPVQLDLRLYEGDQIATPDLSPAAVNAVDGIEFDQHGNPTYYHVLKQHPGDTSLMWMPAGKYDRIPARQMVHLFKRTRPGQARGIPELTASLPTYAILRRWTLACLYSAEAQARITGVIEQDNQLPGTVEEEEEEIADGAGEQIQFAGAHMLTLTAGQSAKTLAHSSPPQNYREFKLENLTDGGRPLGAPRNVSTGSSSEYNYASARLDQQQWQRAIRLRRRRLERLLLNKLFREWAALALLIPGHLPNGVPEVAKWRWQWRWDGFVSIDPAKDAKASTERLANGTSSLDRECGELGDDWEEVQDQRLREEAREIRRRKELGLPPREASSQTQQQGSKQTPDPQEDYEDA